MARDLGGALARTDEYQALKRAMEAADEDRALVAARNRLEEIEDLVGASLRAGREPDAELQASYATAADELQVMPAFQRLIAAQTNFEKVMFKVNETVAQGIHEGARSRIILTP
jgi:cell fate (sporulation/competence/biofilm development) regulator YlbF (YheA/YmcA/DUF963 family)